MKGKNSFTVSDIAMDQNGSIAGSALAGAALILFAVVAKHGDMSFGWVVSKGHLALFK